jgi:hypothetical protein
MTKIYKYETHLHTSEASACAGASAARMVEAYKKTGYAGIIVTDHFLNGNTTVPSELPWAERVKRFCQGYENALAAAGDDGFQVFFGWEYSYHGTDFLTYGLDKAFLLENPQIMTLGVEEYLDLVHRHQGFVVHAHPFREAFYILKLRLYPNHVDAVEVVNGLHENADYDQKALIYAQQYALCQTSGSDAHFDTNLKGKGMAFKKPLATIADFIAGVKEPSSRYLL